MMASITLPTRRVTSSLIRAAYRSSQQQLGCDDVGGQCLLRRYVSLSPLSNNSGQCRRKASTYSSYRETAELSEDVDPFSSLTIPGPTESMVQSFDPVKKSRARKVPLPRSRYQFRPPRYYRGPLHPHQPPPSSSPISRLFVPGPFSLPRLQQTYTSTLAPDLLTLMYTHHPPGTLPGPSGPRLRSWDDSSPYHKNRPLRAPRGAPTLNLLRRPITFQNVPTLSKITVHSFVQAAGLDSAALHVAGMAVQAITNVRCEIHRAKTTIAQFNLREGKAMTVKSELRGEDMWCFLAKLVDCVMPRIKEYEGVSGGSGDGNGNIAMGFSGEVVGLFPEIEVNYDCYPPKMIPGIDVFVCTTATNDKEARLLLSSLGVPFHGKHIN